MRNGILAILPVASVVLMAQAPTPAPEAPTQPFAQQRFTAEQADLDRLITELKPREALARVEAMLPGTPEPFDKRDLKGAMESYQRNASLIRAYSFAGKAAFAGGYWEKSLEYDTKARDVAKQNYEDSKVAFGAAAANLRAAIAQNKQVIDETAGDIAAIKAKPNPDPGEKQQLDLVEQTKAAIVSNEKWAKICDDNVEACKKIMDYYTPRPDETADWIKKETEQLADYKPFPNNKTKYVEGIISSAKFMSQFQDKQSKIQYLYRLNVLDPNNSKVEREINILQGKAVGPEPKHPAKKKG